MFNILEKIKTGLIYLLIILLPLFFLPFTQDFFMLNKLYLLIFFDLIFLTISTFQLIISKKIHWQNQLFTNSLMYLFITVLISTLIMSNNKIQALTNPNYGVVLILSLILFYYYATTKKIDIIKYLQISGILLVFATLIFYLRPLKNTNINFTPLGSQLNLAIFFGFLIIYNLPTVMKKKSYLITGLFSLAFAAAIAKIIIQPNQILLPPLRLSWYAAIEILKNPLTALFGIGIDNFAVIFNQVKDITYNQTAVYANIAYFNTSGSTVLHIFSETGIIGLLGLALVFWQLIKVNFQEKKQVPMIVGIYILIIFIFTPPSLINFFLLTVLLIELSKTKNQSSSTLDLRHIPPLYFSLIIILIIFIAATTYLTIRSYSTEFYLKKSQDVYLSNNTVVIYESQKKAVLANPYLEKAHLYFSQTNLLIANNIASKTIAQKDYKLTEQEKQMLVQAIQIAIDEAKAAVNLNVRKSSNWENLAEIYRQIIPATNQAENWTVSAYLQAIKNDPQNPSYWLNLGKVYYALGKYEEAVKMFEQTILAKPDWSSAYYNLAWGLYQKKDYNNAAIALQTTLSLVDKKNKTDYTKISGELEEFKKKIPSHTN